MTQFCALQPRTWPGSDPSTLCVLRAPASASGLTEEADNLQLTLDGGTEEEHLFLVEGKT